ncbi:NACHT domain-containing protein [Gigaspora margarita]|uniref:NACHT domain-containing protein n=1 Tax=Gigaspora margarita TaxID=4874 RepID=A0A8H4EPA7_GIGMA|nr:NACHT domain-containing protein [Gigaspora margarita]
MIETPATDQLEQAIINEKDIDHINYNKFTQPELIRTGGFGSVFKCELKDSNIVVLKRPKFDGASNEKIKKLIDDFIKECKLLKFLSVCENLNIIKFYGVTKDNNGLYNMVLQYSNEGDLQQYLNLKAKELQWSKKLDIAMGIACGLSFLHDKGIIHRDLHSENILIHQGKPKITDLGASKQINMESKASDSEVIGVLEYTDPQCILSKDGKYEHNEKSDIYSFGVILWEISSGKSPFQSIKPETRLSVYICRGKREEPIESTPSKYLELYKKCWDHDPDNRPKTNLIPRTLENIIHDEIQIEERMKNLEGAQSSDLERNRIDMLAQIGELENQNDTHEFKEALELYVKPRGKWKVPIVKTLASKEEMYETLKEGDVEKVVNRFLASKDKLTSHDKEILENAANEFLIKQENALLIKTVNNFFEAENKLTLEDLNLLNIAANQFLVLKDKKALKLLEIAINEFSESPKERVLKNAICNFFENTLVLEDKLSLKNKLDLGSQITSEDEQTLKKASKKDKENFVKIVNEFLDLKAKEVLETAVNNLLTSKRKKVLLLLGSGGTGKSTFNRYFARRLWECAKNDMTQSIPLFIALAPLEGLINKNRDFIEAYLREKGNLSSDQIKELRNRKFVFILDGYDEIVERERHCYDSNMFTEWKNAKIIISCRPEYLDEGSRERFWPKENGKKGFQELILTPFSWVEIEQYIKNYVDYSKKNGSQLLWDADRYIQEIKAISQIEELVCNPVLLKIILTILPDLRKSGTSQINRIVLYEEFIKKWFERAQERLQKIQLKKEEREEFDRLKVDFTEHCLRFGKEFAFKMFVDNNKVVVDYDPINEKITSEWAKFLGNEDVKLLLIRFNMPLFRRGNQYWFFHKSLRDYLISCALLDSLKDTSQATRFNMQSITPEPAIQQFLAEQVKQMPEYKQPLFDFIEYSKRNTNIRNASANAIMVLSCASISVNLSNIRIPGTDLSNGNFNNLQFTRADLNNVNFQNANLQNANLTDADLTGANLRRSNNQGSNLQGVNLQKANLEGASLQNANLEGASLENANLEGASLQDAKLMSANLSGAILRRLNLQNANLEGASLQNANLQHANIQNVNLEGASLQEANLTGANFSNANLRRSILQDAKFYDTNLNNVKF